MFTLTDIRNIAVQIEQNGEETYRRAARQTSDPELAQMLNWLADEEKRHGKLFASIVIEKTLTAEEAELAAREAERAALAPRDWPGAKPAMRSDPSGRTVSP